MPDYEKMYYSLFNSITDALSELENHHYSTVEQILKAAQQNSEEMYMDE